MAQYQDIVLPNGKTKKGQRDCEPRWKLIEKEIKKKYNRPVTVLDIGANFGYFSFRIQEILPGSVVTLIESKHAKRLVELCEKLDADYTIVLDKLINTEELLNLAKCEHFDIVLGLNVLHHIGDVEQSFSAIEQLGDTVIIETPHPNDEGACGQKNLESLYNKVMKEYNIIGEFSRHTSNTNSPIGIKHIKKTTTERRYWDSKLYQNKILIESTKDQKTIYHIDKNEKKDWIHGINLRTYQYLNGQYPSRKQLVDAVKKLNLDDHEDVNPWNLILTGNNLIAIDAKDPRHTKPTNNVKQKQKIIDDLLSVEINSIKTYKK